MLLEQALQHTGLEFDILDGLLVEKMAIGVAGGNSAGRHVGLQGEQTAPEFAVRNPRAGASTTKTVVQVRKRRKSWLPRGAWHRQSRQPP